MFYVYNKFFFIMKISYKLLDFFNLHSFRQKGCNIVKVKYILKMLNITFRKISFITFIIKTFDKMFIKFRNNLQPTQNHLLAAFVTLPIHINYLHSNIKDMTVPFFFVIFHVFVISSWISMNSLTYSSSDTFFYQ